MSKWLRIAIVCNIGQWVSVVANFFIEPYGLYTSALLAIPLIVAVWRYNKE